MQNASYQLALGLFEDFSARGESVAAAPLDLGFRRSNAFIKIEDLSLTARRLVDVTYFLVADDPEIRKEYRVDYGLFKWLMCTTSENRRHLRTLIREAQRSAIVIDADEPNKERWGSVPLMHDAFIEGGEFIFELSERIQRAIKNPKATHFLSLRYVFKSIHSKILFDRLQPYLADGVTPWFEVATMRAMMECETKTYDLFKHFRSKVLDVAMTEILEVTGIRIEMVTQNVPGSKRIGQLRFRIQGTLPAEGQKTALIVLKSLYETLRTEFALNKTEFNEIIANRSTYTDDRINQAIEYTRHMAAKGKVKVRAGGYFMKALREDYLLGSLDKDIHQQALALESTPQASQQSADTREAQLSAADAEKKQKEVALGWQHYNTLSDEEQSDLVAEFTCSPSARLIANVIKVEPQSLLSHLTDPKVHSTFGSFVASKALKKAKAKRAATAAVVDEA
ncbi:replication initiation protein RepB [Paraburkholderia hospita]|uniref:Replication initiation protein RepB n=1 Tax=Paraburkholderia hospita TaxID=169430 RepID=A0ABN0FDI7_9BURK|nr:replication initiation protein [Paraburkholderia hospita]EIM96695.1 replication initiation protein RepB [Paraburkholderia hospita]OUL87798.1 replication initiation protein [Paraburkholderia hospita]